MESLLKIIGPEIYIGSFLFSSGLEGRAYVEKLREAETLAQLMTDQYDAGFEDCATARYTSGYEEGKDDTTYAPEPQPQSAT